MVSKTRKSVHRHSWVSVARLLLSETLSFVSGHGSVRQSANGEQEKLARPVK